MHKKWDERFLRLAKEISTWSKDVTGIGCVITTPDRRIISTGYNGIPRRCDDNVEAHPERHIRPPEGNKYAWVEHSERNALYNALFLGVSVRGCNAYITAPPCVDCARGLIQSGIKRVIWTEPDDPGFMTRWADSIKVSEEMFAEADVKTVSLSL